jgi:hypothetical protein
MHQTQSSRYLISFSYEKLKDARIDNVFFWINRVETITRSFPWYYITDVMTYFGHSIHSAIFYKAGSPLKAKAGAFRLAQ